jgi:hypothetical protein
MSDQYKNVATIAVVVAVVAVAAVAVLLLPDGKTEAPVITLTLDDPTSPKYIEIDPHIVKGLVEGDIVVFSNKTGFDATVTFTSATPFIKNEIKIPTGNNPQPEAATIVVNPKVVTDYTYTVTAGDYSSDDGSDQSPVIRVGPKPSRTED